MAYGIIYFFSPDDAISWRVGCRVDVATLPKPTVSRNIIYEDRRQVKSVVSRRVRQEDVANSVNSVVTLQRGCLAKSVPSSLLLLSSRTSDATVGAAHSNSRRPLAWHTLLVLVWSESGDFSQTYGKNEVYVFSAANLVSVKFAPEFNGQRILKVSWWSFFRKNSNKQNKKKHTPPKAIPLC